MQQTKGKHHFHDKLISGGIRAKWKLPASEMNNWG